MICETAAKVLLSVYIVKIAELMYIYVDRAENMNDRRIKLVYVQIWLARRTFSIIHNNNNNNILFCGAAYMQTDDITSVGPNKYDAQASSHIV